MPWVEYVRQTAIAGISHVQFALADTQPKAIAMRMEQKRIVLAAALMLHQSPLWSQNAKDNLDSLPTDSIAIVSLNLDAARNHPDLALTPWEVVSAFSTDQLGIDVLKSQSIEVCIGMPGPAGPEFGAMFQAKEKVDIGDLRMPGLGQIEQSPKNPQLRFRKLSDAPLRIAQLEPQTVLAGTDATLRRILAARPTKSKAVSARPSISMSFGLY